MTQNITKLSCAFAFIIVLVLSAGGCRHYDNFTTYFNTYYNADRLLKESLDEFEYQDEKKRVTPHIYVPESQLKIANTNPSGPPPFMKEFIIEQQKLQPVKIKLDSIIIKGSKILAKHPKSAYIEKTLYLMAKSYFYQNIWLASEIKCSELADKFPTCDLAPDALLLFSENLLIEKKFHAGKIMPSRCVDIAWQKKRYDILSEAFRFQADLALYENDMNGAVRPYKQAIAQSEDNEVKARWQVEMAALYYRMGKFKEAEKNFALVHKYTPDYLAEFESYLYQALSLIRIGRFVEGEKILTKLESNRNYDEWMPFIFAARMSSLRLQHRDAEFIDAEHYADSAYINNPAILAVYYEKGMEYFENHDYNTARKYFSRSRNLRSPVYNSSEWIFYRLNLWSQKRQQIYTFMELKSMGKPIPDSIKPATAQALFELGRVHEQLGNMDSSLYYYRTAVEVSPPTDVRSARYLYAYARSIQEKEPIRADSILDVLVLNYPGTEYGQDAIVKQGYTDKFVIDTAADYFNSGNSLRLNKEYAFAITQLQKVYSGFPDSKYAPRSLYTIGWVYEKNLKVADSAFYYYKLLMNKYPESEYAKEVALSVNYLSAVKSGQPIPDSLKTREIVKDTHGPKNDLKKPGNPQEQQTGNPQAQGGNPPNTPGNFNPMDMIKNPSNILKNAEQSLSNPSKLIPNVNLPVDPGALFNNKTNNMPMQDTLKPKEPEPKK